MSSMDRIKELESENKQLKKKIEQQQKELEKYEILKKAVNACNDIGVLPKELAEILHNNRSEMDEDVKKDTDKIIHVLEDDNEN